MVQHIDSGYVKRKVNKATSSKYEAKPQREFEQKCAVAETLETGSCNQFIIISAAFNLENDPQYELRLPQ
jgi:hypothetical protein